MEEKTGAKNVPSEKKVGKSPETLKETRPEKPTVEKSKAVELTFRENRMYELHIGRKVIRFNPRETKKIHADILIHADFTENVKKLFIIKGGES